VRAGRPDRGHDPFADLIDGCRDCVLRPVTVENPVPPLCRGDHERADDDLLRCGVGNPQAANSVEVAGCRRRTVILSGHAGPDPL